MFKVGDKVWCKSHKYNMVSWHRPCEVISIGNLIHGRMLVRVLDTGRRYEVDSNNFETITEDKILHKGDILEYEGENLIFLGYQDFAIALCKRSDDSKIRVELEDIRRVGGFFV